MAHRIEKMDAQHGIEQAWHGLTQVNPELHKLFIDGKTFLNSWDVVTVPMFTQAGQPIVVDESFGEAGETKLVNWSILQCTDNQAFIGRPFNPESFKPVNNARFLELMREAIAGTGHKVVSLGSVCNRGRVFISVELEEIKGLKAAGREMESFLNFGHGFDQSCVFYANTSNIKTVCNNTFTMNLFHKGKLVNFRVKQTKNSQAKLDNLPEMIDAAIGVQKEFALVMDSLADQKVTETQAERVFTGFVAPIGLENAENPELSTRSRNTVERLMQLFKSGAGNRGENKADLFSAATDFYTHESSGGENLWKQFVSSEFGSGLRKKEAFFEMLTKTETQFGKQVYSAYNKAMKRGESILVAQ